jgi:hypothetical protein
MGGSSWGASGEVGSDEVEPESETEELEEFMRRVRCAGGVETAR